MALLMDTVGSAKLGKALSIVFGVSGVGSLLSPVVGGIVYDKAGEGTVFGMGLGLLGIDFVLRLVLIEKKVAAKYLTEVDLESPKCSSDWAEEGLDERTPLVSPGVPKNSSESSEASSESEKGPDENKSLISQDSAKKWTIPKDQPNCIRKFPIIYCLKNPRFLAAQLTTFSQATLVAVFDATLPTEARDLFGMDSMRAGLLFVPLGFPPVGPQFHLRPSSGQIPKSYNIVMFCTLLALSGIGIAMTNSPSIVEMTHVVENYHKANKDFFGEHGPYAQMHAIKSMCYCLGLTLGPLAAGVLRDNIGYGNMNACFAGMSLVVGILTLVFYGERKDLVAAEILEDLNETHCPINLEDRS